MAEGSYLIDGTASERHNFFDKVYRQIYKQVGMVNTASHLVLKQPFLRIKKKYVPSTSEKTLYVHFKFTLRHNIVNCRAKINRIRTFSIIDGVLIFGEGGMFRGLSATRCKDLEALEKEAYLASEVFQSVFAPTRWG